MSILPPSFHVTVFQTSAASLSVTGVSHISKAFSFLARQKHFGSPAAEMKNKKGKYEGVYSQRSGTAEVEEKAWGRRKDGEGPVRSGKTVNVRGLVFAAEL